MRLQLHLVLPNYADSGLCKNRLSCTVFHSFWMRPVTLLHLIAEHVSIVHWGGAKLRL